MKYVGQTDDFVLTQENYYSPEANAHYLSHSDYLEHFGSVGLKGCEARAEAIRDGKFSDTDTMALLVGSYVDSAFEGTLEKFKTEHKKEIYTQRGDLRADFVKAEEMIARARQDEYFMKYMTGDKQVIMTGYFAGIWWKIKIDNLMKNSKGQPIAIVDLKTTGKALNQSFYVKDFGNVGFVEYWGYDMQMALYQEIVRINTGLTLPTYICAITKEKEPDIAVICLQGEGGSNMFLDNARNAIENNAEFYKALTSKEIEPVKCESADCMYCRREKKLTEPVFYQDLIMR